MSWVPDVLAGAGAAFLAGIASIGLFLAAWHILRPLRKPPKPPAPGPAAGPPVSHAAAPVPGPGQEPQP